jgi:hypothetical protein
VEAALQGINAQRRGTIDDRVEGMRRKSLRFPQGQRLPPHLSPLLPDTIFPPTRDTPNPIHPIFPPPGNFPGDVGRYFRNEDYLVTQTQSTEVNNMAHISPSYATDALDEKRFFCMNGQTYKNLSTSGTT